MGGSGLINQTVETTGTLIVSAIEHLKESRKLCEEHTIPDYLQKKEGDINRQTYSWTLASLSKNGIILKKV